MRIGLVGPSYESQSVIADCQRAINWYCELVESGRGKNPDRLALYPTAGLAQFANPGGSVNRGGFTIRGRTFCVVDTTLWEIHANGTTTSRGTSLANDNLPVSFTASATEMLLASGGRAYVLNLDTNTFTAIDPAVFGGGDVVQVGFCDGFFLALIADSNQFYVSDLLDALAWPDNALVSVFPGRVVSMIVDHREVWMLGERGSVVYYNSGDLDFPFAVVPGSAIEHGCEATYATVRMDNSVFWIGGDERGRGTARRAQGYTPVRVSTHAVENAWRDYPTLADAVGYAYQERGHDFWVINFPSAGKTWCYDASTGLWHERAWRNPATGALETHLASWATVNFGRVLVGARNSGKVYDMSAAYHTDDGAPIRRVRRSPHVSDENQWLFHAELEIDVETGVGPMPPLLDGNGSPRAPVLMMRFSDDGGRTWSNERMASIGKAGEYSARVIFRRLGRARDRVYEISASEPVPMRVIDAYLRLADAA